MDPNHGSYLDLISVCCGGGGAGGLVMMVMIMLLRPLFVQNETTVPLLLCFKFTFSKSCVPWHPCLSGNLRKIRDNSYFVDEAVPVFNVPFKGSHTYIYGILLRFSKLSWKSIPE